MALTAEAYLEQFLVLLPGGPAWPRDPDGDLGRTLLGLADEFARIDGRAQDLLREFHPATAVELLPEWEAEYQITPPAGATIEARQQVASWRHTAEGDIKKPGLVALAAWLGYTIRIEDCIPSMAGWLCAGDELLEEPWMEFNAGVSDAGDYLAQEDTILPWIWRVIVLAVPATPPTPGLEEVLRAWGPAHIQMNFDYDYL